RKFIFIFIFIFCNLQNIYTQNIYAGNIDCSFYKGAQVNNINDIQKILIQEDKELIESYSCKKQNSNICTDKSICNIISDDAILKMTNQLEEGSEILEGHGSEIIRAKHTNGKTKYSVVLIHGLYLSPKATKEFAELYAKLGFNVINIRLPGHFETPRQKLDSVKWQSWDKKVKQALKLAQNLGEKVIVSGHSSGALLAQKASLDYAHKVKGATPIAGLIGYAPTLQIKKKLISGLQTADSWLGTISGGKDIALSLITEYFSNSSEPIYASLSPSLEVNKMSQYISNKYSKNNNNDDVGIIDGDDNYNNESDEEKESKIISDIYSPLSKIPVMIMDTDSDEIININYNKKVMKFLKQNSEKDIVHVVEKNSCLKHSVYLKKLLQKTRDPSISDINKCSESILDTKIQLLNFIKKNFSDRCNF
ncbi:MAG: alpha/beta fold hydrolase, partial [Bdellovibrionales bacterium]|nr:alpha/beta fold hydrolase [Bdellovibrionales bacterium]